FSIPLLFPAESPEMETIATVLQQSFAKIGIKLELTRVPQATLNSRALVAHDVPLQISNTFAVINPDGAGYTGFFATGTSTAGLFNYPKSAPAGQYLGTGFFDRLHLAGLSSFTQARRKSTYVAAQKAFELDLPFIPIVTFRESYAMKKQVQGFSWWPD